MKLTRAHLQGLGTGLQIGGAVAQAIAANRPAPARVEQEQEERDERRAPHRRLGPIHLLQHMISEGDARRPAREREV